MQLRLINRLIYYVVPWSLAAVALSATAQTVQLRTLGAKRSPLKIVVNSAQDTLAPDTALTLREAIAIANGTLSLDRLSPDERAQVTEGITATDEIRFALPPGENTIYLKELLPAIAQPNLIIDGGNSAPTSTSNPQVAITPAPEADVFRGLTVVGDRITIRGLSLYGFSAKHDRTASTPPADIFIGHRSPPPDKTYQYHPEDSFPFRKTDEPPQGVVIENNWLGIPLDESQAVNSSAFGVSIFNAVGTRILNNRIANHDGSGIISSVRAEQTEIANNIITNNGLSGMPDAIRLEGVIDGIQIRANQITDNAGSGVFLFKPEGFVTIERNQFLGNGNRVPSAAIYLTGNGHQVKQNQIQKQSGPGVVVAAYPTSDRNVILENRFADLKGLSIDLVTRQHTNVQDYRTGDGPNPQRDSGNRRLDTANSAINTPLFLSTEFYLIDGRVNLDGKADPGSTVLLYKSGAGTEPYSPLSQFVGEVEVSETGRFGFTLMEAQAGDRYSAIATDPRYGTSEPAVNVEVKLLP
jgi:Right handed beta helix region